MAEAFAQFTAWLNVVFVEQFAGWILLGFCAQAFFTMPKATCWRTFVMNHVVHHRGQLSVYLRLLDVPVPSIYGPSADEGGL